MTTGPSRPHRPGRRAPVSRHCLLVILAALALLASPQAAAQSGGEPIESDGWELAFDFHVGEGFELRNAQRSQDASTFFNGSFDLNTATLDVEYAHLAPDDEVPERRANTSLTLQAVYVFRDLNDNGRFDLGDEILEHDRFDNRREPTLVYDPLPRGFEGAKATYPLVRGGFVEVEIAVTDAPDHLGQREVRPTEMGLNVTVHDVPIRAEDAEIAVQLRAAGQGVDQAASRIEMQGDGAEIHFTWDEQARLDGAETERGVTTYEQPLQDGEREEAIMFLSTDHASEIKHTMVFGAIHPSQTFEEVIAGILGDARLFLLGLGLAALGVGAAAVVKLRQGRARSFRNA